MYNCDKCVHLIRKMDSKHIYSFDGPAAEFLKYSFPVVTILGLVGNSFSLITVTSKRCKKSSFTVYIGALAVVDSCMLVFHLLDTLIIGAYNVNLGRHDSAICKCIRYSQSAFRHISAWIIVAITIERVQATIHPHRFKGIYTTKFGIKVVGTLAVISLLLSAHILYSQDYSYINQDPVCNEGYQDVMTLTVIVITFFTSSIFPLTIITMGNIATVIKMKRSRRQIAPMTSSGQSTNSMSRHLCIITLLISTAFVVLTVPFFVALSISSFAFDDTNDTQRQAVFSVVLTLQNLNFATNFYLYILSGRRFRELFISAIMCNQRRTPAQVTTGHQTKSSHCKKSSQTATRNHHFGTVTLVDETRKETRPKGSQAKDKTTRGTDTTRNSSYHGNIQPGNKKKAISIQDDTTSAVIHPYDTARVTSLQDDMTSAAIQLYDTTKVTSLQDDMTSAAIQLYDTTRVTSLQDDMTSTVIQLYDTTKVTSLQDDMTSAAIQPYDTTRVTSLQDDMTSAAIQPYNTTEVTSLHDDVTCTVIQPYDTTKLISLQDDTTSAAIQPYDTTKLTSLKDDTTSTAIQPYDTTKVTSLQDDMTNTAIQPYDTTKLTSLKDDMTSAAI